MQQNETCYLLFIIFVHHDRREARVGVSVCSAGRGCSVISTLGSRAAGETAFYWKPTNLYSGGPTNDSSVCRQASVSPGRVSRNQQCNA